MAPSSGRPLKPLKQERALRTRSVILDAAAEVFAKEGFASVTLQDVAERAGLTKGALYFHFSNKESLATEIVNIYLARWPPLIKSIEEAGMSPLDTLIEILDRAEEAFRGNVMIQAAARLQIERSLIHADLPTPYTSWVTTLSEVTQRAKDAGELRENVDPQAAARFIVSSFFGMQHVSDVLTGRADQRARYEEMRDLLLEGIRA
ncbi:ScbR family autoregulator-binding transcription factor [Streptomyces sp. NPDC088387]|uniref:ScbR family autoregulator-binding transcription factor n=1 Tax=Streptomyces sp. NPDC088387 TaxID=3365859 RepID=UPI0037FC8B86